MSYFPTDIPFMSDAELIENGLKKPYKKPEIIKGTDLVPVIRCKNCKHLANRDEEGGKCWRGSGFARAVKNNDFCSYGERESEHER